MPRQAGALEIEIAREMPSVVEDIASELRGLNFEFESEIDAATRIYEIVVDFMEAQL